MTSQKVDKQKEKEYLKGFKERLVMETGAKKTGHLNKKELEEFLKRTKADYRNKS